MIYEMKLQTQITDWACLPAAAAMAVGIDQSKILNYIGHDGSETMWPLEKYPDNMRAFHIQEVVDYIIKETNWIPFCVDAQPAFAPQPPETEAKRIWTDDVQLKRINTYLNDYHGFLLVQDSIGKGHAVAWDGQRVYDPRGRILDEFLGYSIAQFYGLVIRK